MENIGVLLQDVFSIAKDASPYMWVAIVAYFLLSLFNETKFYKTGYWLGKGLSKFGTLKFGNLWGKMEKVFILSVVSFVKGFGDGIVADDNGVPVGAAKKENAEFEISQRLEKKRNGSK